MTGQLFDAGGPVRTGGGKRRLTPVKKCAVVGCENLRRIGVQAAKYCDEHATSRSYELTGLQGAECYVCGASITARSGSATPMCRDHQHLREMLVRWRRVYRIDRAHARRLLDNPTCWICGESLAWRFTGRAYRGGKIEAVHVDHDHGCRNGCSGGSSCGECVRGLTHQECNHNLGHLETLIKRVGIARAHAVMDVLADDG